MKKSKKKKAKPGIIVLVIVALLILVNIYENLSIGVTSYQIDCSASDGFRIVQISDVHMIRSTHQDDVIYKKVLDLHPDIVAITGDLVDSDKYSNEEYQELTIGFCTHLASIAPVYYIYGNHEIMLLDDPQNNAFKLALEKEGVKIFNNTAEVIKVGKSTYNLLGVQDPATLYKDPKYAYGNKTASILTDLTGEIDQSIPTVLLAHRPELFEVYTKDFNIDITLSGHAHGGQFRIPFTNIGFYAPNQGFLPNYTSGIYENDGNIMIVSRGIGNSKFPFRLFNMPEIVVVDIQ